MDELLRYGADYPYGAAKEGRVGHPGNEFLVERVHPSSAALAAGGWSSSSRHFERQVPHGFKLLDGRQPGTHAAFGKVDVPRVLQGVYRRAGDRLRKVVVLASENGQVFLADEGAKNLS